MSYTVKIGEQNKQRAELIVEYMDCMCEDERIRIEESTLWTHKLEPASTFHQTVYSSEWHGVGESIKEHFVDNSTAVNEDLKRWLKKVIQLRIDRRGFI